MGIAEDIGVRCRRCLHEAAQTLEAVSRGEVSSPVTVRARRVAADIAADAACAALGRAFITPLDREDLWLLRQCAEAVLCAAEEVGLCAYHGGVLPDCCVPLLQATAHGCRQLGTVWERFPDADITAPLLRPLREAHAILHTLRHDRFADMTVRRLTDGVGRVIDAGIRLAECRQYAALKNG